jgi:hypothetical protein
MASKKYFVDLDLQKQSLLQAVVQNIAASGVISPSIGQIIFNLQTNQLAYHNGSDWQNVSQVTVDTVNYKGGIAASGTVSNPDTGDMYIFTTSGIATNFGGVTVEAGDFTIYNGLTWDTIQRNIDYATTSTSGFVQLSTDSEAISGTSTTKVITPSNLTAWQNQTDKTVVRKRVYTNQSLSTTPLVLTHGIGSSDVVVQVFDSISGEEIIVDIVKGSGTVTISTNTSITANVVILA